MVTQNYVGGTISKEAQIKFIPNSGAFQVRAIDHFIL